jgi:hypothetical protein
LKPGDDFGGVAYFLLDLVGRSAVPIAAYIRFAIAAPAAASVQHASLLRCML